MQICIRLFRVALILSGILIWSGCSRSNEHGSSSPPQTEVKHDDHGHDHGSHTHESGHPHAEHGPHHGQLIDLGHGEYHAEVVHDDTTDTITVYVLDSS